jgi:lipoprotein-anchoring transpeptidase ErfK/SrfK
LAVGLVFAGLSTPSVAAVLRHASTPTAKHRLPKPALPALHGSATIAPLDNRLPAGVRVAGVRIGRMWPKVAARAVRKAFASPLVVTVNNTRVRLGPGALSTPYIDGALRRAKASRPGTKIRLVVAVKGAAVRAAVAKLARRVDRRSTSVQVEFRGSRPYVPQQAYGQELDQGKVVIGIVHQLTKNERRPMRFATRTLRPRFLAGAAAAVVVINRSTNTLSLYEGAKLWRQFRVATGQAAYPTPQGRFRIVVKYVDPTWYPPAYDDWARGLSPVPPGPDNPLGTRWMGLSASGVGIHGTNNPASIGYSVSHGCIRMQVADSEWLFSHVEIGTTVLIV